MKEENDKTPKPNQSLLEKTLEPTKKHKAIMKEKRKKQYESIAKECLNSGLNLSDVRVEDFAESRKKELAKFIQIINSKYSSKSGHQLLPKHMRRRSMSHNPFRIPIRSRLILNNSLSRSKCRKHKRKQRNLKKSIIRRACKNNWLETHLWHAKRFHMKKKFGYKIAHKRLDKGYKASYRYSKYFSCIYDSSYMNYIIITATDVPGLFRFILDNFTIDGYENVKEFYAYKVNLYHSTRLVGPAVLILLGGALMIKFHPLMKEEVFDLLNTNSIMFKEKFNANILYNRRINTFDLIGPKVIQNVLKVFKSLDTDNVIDHNNFTELVNNSPNGKCFLLKLKKPISQFKMNEFVFNTLTDKVIPMNVEYSSDHMEKLNSIASDDFIQMINQKSESLVEAMKKQAQEYKEVEMKFETERTLFVHRKKMNLEKLNEKLNKSMRHKKRKENLILQPKKDSVFDLDRSSTPNLDVHNNETTYIMLVKHNFQTLKEKNYAYNVPNFSLIFPHGYSVDLLRRFVYLGTRPYGFKEYQYYLTRNNQLVFPEDYPSTSSYLHYMKNKTHVKMLKYCMYPASKRVNFQKLGCPSPFYSSWRVIDNKTNSFEEFNQQVEVISNLTNKLSLAKQFNIQKILNKEVKTFLLPVTIQSISKGIPNFNTMICLPEEIDVFHYKKFSDLGVNKRNYLHKLLDNFDKAEEIQHAYSQRHQHILEPKHYTETKNKSFNLEYKAIIKAKEESIKFNGDILNEDFTLKMPANYQNTRPTIGFVTSGIYDYHLSRGVGKGFILLSSYERLVTMRRDNELEHLVVLIRNQTSRMYYWAKVSLVNI